MRISDEERREVAQKLREDPERIGPGDLTDGELLDVIAADVGVRASCNDFDAKLMDRLADLIEPMPVSGDTSDGYHTFNELYHHRAVLFSVVVAAFSEKAWRAKAHHDGTMYDGMLIVGIETPDGQATYHYDITPYWNMFRCRELDRAPEWDGHTPSQAIERIGKLVDLIDRPTTTLTEDEDERTCCANCGCAALYMSDATYCPDRAAEVVPDGC